MSMLSVKCARLRSWAAQFDERADIDALAPLLASDLREAADTIEGLRDRLQESYGQVPELGKRENGSERESYGSRWHQLFGTPEKTAEYFAMQCFGSDGGLCHYCPFDDCDERLRNTGTYPSVHDKMMEWLRGDA